MNLPNLITFSRLLGIPFILWFLQGDNPRLQSWALGVFLVMALTDWLDGYLARKLDQVTDLGKFLDPLVDKLLVFAPFLMLVEKGLIPAWGVFVILARELAISGWRVNPQQGKIQGANLWGKVKTVVQIVAIALLMWSLGQPEMLWAGQMMFWVAVGLTVVSGILYVVPPQES